MTERYDRWYDPDEPAWAGEPTAEWQAAFPGQRYPGDLGPQRPPPAPSTAGRPGTAYGRAGVYRSGRLPAPADPIPRDPTLHGSAPSGLRGRPAPPDPLPPHPVEPADEPGWFDAADTPPRPGRSTSSDPFDRPGSMSSYGLSSFADYVPSPGSIVRPDPDIAVRAPEPAGPPPEAGHDSRRVDGPSAEPGVDRDGLDGGFEPAPGHRPPDDHPPPGGWADLRQGLPPHAPVPPARRSGAGRVVPPAWPERDPEPPAGRPGRRAEGWGSPTPPPQADPARHVDALDTPSQPTARRRPPATGLRLEFLPAPAATPGSRATPPDAAPAPTAGGAPASADAPPTAIPGAPPTAIADAPADRCEAEATTGTANPPGTDVSDAEPFPAAPFPAAMPAGARPVPASAGVPAPEPPAAAQPSPAGASPDTVLPLPAGPAAGAATALRAPTVLAPLVMASAPEADRPVARSTRAGDARTADPEQVLASYGWRFHPETLRELVDDPDELRVIRDRLTEKVESVGDNAGRARLLSLRAVVSRILGDLGRALADGKLAVAHAEATGELRRIAIARARLAHVLQWRGDFAQADRLFAAANSSELPDPLRATMHEHAGRSCYDQGRYIEACNHFERALELRKVEDPELIARTELALDAVFSRVARDGWGPYPRTREEILGVRRSPVPAFSDEVRRWGYADPAGRLTIEPSYADVQPFRDGVAWVRRPETRNWELIDESGETLIDASAGYPGVGSFSDGLAWVSRDGVGSWIAIDRDNTVVISAGFEDVRPFRAGLAAVRRGGWGAVDRAGRVVLPLRNSGFVTALTDGRYVDGFTDEGLAIVDIGGRKGVVDRTGRVIVPPAHAALVIHPVAFLVGTGAGQWGALDRRGEPLIDPVRPSRAAVMDEIDRLLADTRPVL